MSPLSVFPRLEVHNIALMQAVGLDDAVATALLTNKNLHADAYHATDHLCDNINFACDAYRFYSTQFDHGPLELMILVQAYHDFAHTLSGCEDSTNITQALAGFKRSSAYKHISQEWQDLAIQMLNATEYPHKPVEGQYKELLLAMQDIDLLTPHVPDPIGLLRKFQKERKMTDAEMLDDGVQFWRNVKYKSDFGRSYDPAKVTELIEKIRQSFSPRKSRAKHASSSN